MSERDQKQDRGSVLKHGARAIFSRFRHPWCALLGHKPKQYCEHVEHYEVRCRRCGWVLAWVGQGKDPRE